MLMLQSSLSFVVVDCEVAFLRAALLNVFLSLRLQCRRCSLVMLVDDEKCWQ